MDNDAPASRSDASTVLRAHTFNEVRYYLMVTACAECGKGPWEIEETAETRTPGEANVVRAKCRQCGAERDFVFTCDAVLPTRGAQAETISLSDRPSRIIDLGQWLSLFYLLVESASAATSKPATRRDGYRAAMCLAEALRFYGGDDELPPASALFTERSAAAFHEHPENFTRQKLRDMQAKLPSTGAMHRNVNRDEDAAGRRWWQFWRH